MDENQVVAAICAHLSANSYLILERRHTTEQGVDIVARHETGRLLYIEAKGGTSSRNGSARFGNPYTQSQVFDRVAKGVFTGLELVAKLPDRTKSEVALAVPDGRYFRRYLEPVRAQLASVGLKVFFVGEGDSIVEL